MRTLLRTKLYCYVVAACALLALPGCPPTLPAPGQAPTSPGTRGEPASSVALDPYARINEQLKLLANKALCSPEVRSLIKLIEHECGVRECSAEDLRALTRLIEPRQRFMWLMREVPHVVVYLKENSAAMAAKDAIVDERQYNLRRLLSPPWLDFAQVWIVAHSSVKDTNRDFAALERAQKVKQLITELRFGKAQLRFPASHILKVSYDFPLVTPTAKQLTPGPDKNEFLTTLELLNKNVLLKNDLPIYGEPPDIGRGVWVFLIDCVGEP